MPFRALSYTQNLLFRDKEERWKICPVEVKSSVYQAHSSLDKFRRKFSPFLGNAYILYTKDIMIKDNVIHLPIYMAMFL